MERAHDKIKLGIWSDYPVFPEFNTDLIGDDRGFTLIHPFRSVTFCIWAHLFWITAMERWAVLRKRILVICEKPKAARRIAEALDDHGRPERNYDNDVPYYIVKAINL